MSRSFLFGRSHFHSYLRKLMFSMFFAKFKYAWDALKEVVCVLLLCVWGPVGLCIFPMRKIFSITRVLMKWTGCVCYCVLPLCVCVCYCFIMSLEERCSTTSCWHMGRGIWAGMRWSDWSRLCLVWSSEYFLVFFCHRHFKKNILTALSNLVIRAWFGFCHKHEDEARFQRDGLIGSFLLFGLLAFHMPL